MATNIGTALFGLTGKQYRKLTRRGVEDADYLLLAETTHKGDSESVNQLTKIGFMYYIDQHGNFMDKRLARCSNQDRIMKMAFENLEIISKIEIAEYEDNLE